VRVSHGAVAAARQWRKAREQEADRLFIGKHKAVGCFLVRQG
jgi:hypothetical protein